MFPRLLKSILGIYLSMSCGVLRAETLEEGNHCTDEQLASAANVVKEVFSHAQGYRSILLGRCGMSTSGTVDDRPLCVVVKWQEQADFVQASRVFGPHFLVQGCLVVFEDPLADGSVIVHN